jgi:UDPglucose 6-dehydrogenase
MSKKNQENIAVIGAGYVGITVGVCFASLGYKVVLIDKDRKKISALKNKKSPIFEPGLEELLRKYYKNLSFKKNIKNIISSSIVFICVGTPQDNQGRADLSAYKSVIQAIAKNLIEYKIIVNKSTVPVGTGNWTIKEIKKKYKGSFAIVSNPEFLREGSAINDFLNPDRIVIGTNNSKAAKTMLSIYRQIKAPKIITDIKSAEIIKYAANAFLGTKISFINEIANICELIGADINKVAQGIGSDKRIGSKFLKAGIGYGGSCFPKDISALVKTAQDKRYTFKLLRAVISVNRKQKNRFLKKIIKTLEKNRGKKIAILGLSFKPGTDDIRKSPAIEIIKMLQKENFIIQTYDPKAMKNTMNILGEKKNIIFCKNAYEAAKDADLLAITTEWPEFEKINFKKIKKLMSQSFIIDGRNQLDPKKIKKIGFYYKSIGRKT